MTEKSHDRAAGQTQISVSMPESLLQEIDRLAKLDKRSRSNWIVAKLEPIVEAELARKKITVLPLDAPAGDLSSSRVAESSEYPQPGPTPRAVGIRSKLRRMSAKEKKSGG